MIEFEKESPPNDTHIYRSRSGTLDGVTFTAVTAPSDEFSLMINFIEQSEFIVEMALHMEYNVAGVDVTEIVIPFPTNMLELLPTLEDGLPPFFADNDVTTPYQCSFYYTQTELVSGIVQLGIRSGVPVFILTPDSPVNLIKVNCNPKWQKIINLIIYS